MDAAGTAFLATDPRSRREHLWVVLSDPKIGRDRVLIANITSLDKYKERACVVQRGEHPWVTHDSCVFYEESRITSLDNLYLGKDKGLFKLADPVTPALLKRMRDGILDSTRVAIENADLLIDQGLVQC